MTKKQKLQIEQSEKRQKLNDLLAKESLSDEERAELETLTKRMQEIEPELRAAIVAEGDEEARARGMFGPDDGEAGERGRLLRETTLSDYLKPATGGAALQGRAAELNAALEVPTIGTELGGIVVPIQMIECPEHRATVNMVTRDGVERYEYRADTTTTQNPGGESQRPILQRLFGPGILNTLGVRMDAVPVGRVEWPLLSSGVTPAQAKETVAAADAVAATFTFANLKPKRLTGEYRFSHEEAATVPAIEQALRRDLGDSVRAAMSNLIVNGPAPTEANPQHVQGFLATINAPDDAGAEAVYADYAGAHAVGIDGIHAEMETEVSSVIGTDVYQHASKVFNDGSGESGTEALARRSMSCRASSYIPAADSGQSKGNLFHLAGPNGGGVMRGDSVAAMWPTLEIIRDIYTRASQGVVLTWVSMWDAKVAFRAAAYRRVAFKLTS